MMNVMLMAMMQNIGGSVAAKFEYKAYSNIAARKIEFLYIRIYMVILWPNIEYSATK